MNRNTFEVEFPFEVSSLDPLDRRYLHQPANEARQGLAEHVLLVTPDGTMPVDAAVNAHFRGEAIDLLAPIWNVGACRLVRTPLLDVRDEGYAAWPVRMSTRAPFALSVTMGRNQVVAVAGGRLVTADYVDEDLHGIAVIDCDRAIQYARPDYVEMPEFGSPQHLWTPITKTGTFLACNGGVSGDLAMALAAGPIRETG